ncbi:hypothetical protein P4O66_020048, partial [Electrophorus voltai]
WNRGNSLWPLVPYEPAWLMEVINGSSTFGLVERRHGAAGTLCLDIFSTSPLNVRFLSELICEDRVMPASQRYEGNGVPVGQGSTSSAASRLSFPRSSVPAVGTDLRPRRTALETRAQAFVSLGWSSMDMPRSVASARGTRGEQKPRLPPPLAGAQEKDCLGCHLSSSLELVTVAPTVRGAEQHNVRGHVLVPKLERFSYPSKPDPVHAENWMRTLAHLSGRYWSPNPFQFVSLLTCCHLPSLELGLFPGKTEAALQNIMLQRTLHLKIVVKSRLFIFFMFTAMELLVTELTVLLKLLDHETLSSATEEKKSAVKNLLAQFQPTVPGTDYMYMNTSVYRNGTSFVESLFEKFDCDLGDLRVEAEEQNKELNQTDRATPSKPRRAHTPPPLPNTPPPEDYYEEALPLSPGTLPEYITSRGSSSPPNSIEDGYYEDTEQNYPTTCTNSHRKNSYNDSDALSSSYESYDEEEEEKRQRLTHQWPSEENSMAPVRDCRICAFLLRKKRFGQWAKQLTVIRENRLQCYKSSKDQSPYMDLPLSLCNVIYVPKDGRKKKHELRFSLPGGEALVLAVQSKEQAEKWLRVVREISSLGNGLNSSTSPMTPRRTELDKRLSAEKPASDSDTVPSGECCRDVGKVKRGALSELTGTMSRAAGRKITRIISFSRRKPPLPGDPRWTSPEENPGCGYLSILVNQCWKERWCRVSCGSLHLHQEQGDPRRCHAPIALQGCDVLPGFGSKHPFALRILRGSSEVAVLEARGSEEMGRWLGVLLAETGCSADPESLHYDYVDVETIANIRTAARHSFLWATSTESRTYDEVPCEETREGDRLGEQQDKSRNKPPITLKRHGPSANQYGRYGKTRAEEDARRYLREKEELEQERDSIRNALVSLRKDKREAKAKLKGATDKQQRALEEHVAHLEESCHLKEGQRVDLELRLTQVKENLKKSLAGGVLGAPAQTTPLSKKTRQPEAQYIESFLPVNCASEMRKRPSSIYTSAKGNVMQKAKEWESKRGT